MTYQSVRSFQSFPGVFPDSTPSAHMSTILSRVFPEFPEFFRNLLNYCGTTYTLHHIVFPEFPEFFENCLNLLGAMSKSHYIVQGSPEFPEFVWNLLNC